MTEQTEPSTISLTLTGILSIVLGIVAIATPAVAGTAVVLVIGVILLAAGLAQTISGLRLEGWSRKLLPLILGILTVFAGLGVLGHPLLGLSFLTLLLALFFAAEGAWKIIASFSYRPASGWLAVLVSGILTMLLGLLIWSEWPFSGLWAVGILVGVDLLITGISLVTVASTVRRLKKLAENAAA